MADAFIAEIRIFTGNFAPKNWAFCDGSLMPISQNTALFSLIGTYYGGNGTTTFGLPDLRGSVPMQHGNGPNLTPRELGEVTGSTTHTLISSEMPAHTHGLRSTAAAATQAMPGSTSLFGVAPGSRSQQGPAVYADSNPNTILHDTAISPAGTGVPFSLIKPVLSMNYIICLFGTFPSRP